MVLSGFSVYSRNTAIVLIIFDPFDGIIGSLVRSLVEHQTVTPLVGNSIPRESDGFLDPPHGARKYSTLPRSNKGKVP